MPAQEHLLIKVRKPNIAIHTPQREHPAGMLTEAVLKTDGTGSRGHQVIMYQLINSRCHRHYLHTRTHTQKSLDPAVRAPMFLCIWVIQVLSWKQLHSVLSMVPYHLTLVRLGWQSSRTANYN